MEIVDISGGNVRHRRLWDVALYMQHLSDENIRIELEVVVQRANGNIIRKNMISATFLTRTKGITFMMNGLDYPSSALSLTFKIRMKMVGPRPQPNNSFVPANP